MSNTNNSPTEITLSMPSKHLQVLILLEQGYTKKEIANHIYTSYGNADKIISTLLQNFESKNCTQLVAKAIRRGII